MNVKEPIGGFDILHMSCSHHLDCFASSAIIEELEEGRRIADVVEEYYIVHYIVSCLWRVLQRNGSVTGVTGEVMFTIVGYKRDKYCPINKWDRLITAR